MAKYYRMCVCIRTHCQVLCYSTKKTNECMSLGLNKINAYTVESIIISIVMNYTVLLLLREISLHFYTGHLTLLSYLFNISCHFPLTIVVLIVYLYRVDYRMIIK